MWSREPSPSEKQENKQKATQDVSKSKNGPDQSISKSETGAISKITTEITAKPENRKNDLWLRYGNRNAERRELAAAENMHSRAGEPSKLASHTGLNMRAGGGSVSGDADKCEAVLCGS